MSNINLIDISLKMSDKAGSIVDLVELVADVDTKLTELKCDMEDALRKGHEAVGFPQFIREVRMLSGLLNYLVSDLIDNADVVYELQDSIFHIVGRNKDESSSQVG